MVVTDDAISKIKAKIIAGELKPGERLPREADLLAVRLILESAAAALAGRRLAPDEIAAIRDVSAGDSLSTPVNDLVDHDLRFHALIAIGSDNPLLAYILDSIAMLTTRARIWRGLAQEDAYPHTIAEHVAIVEALEMHDPQLAAARAMVHVAGVGARLRRALLWAPTGVSVGATQEPIG